MMENKIDQSAESTAAALNIFGLSSAISAAPFPQMKDQGYSFFEFHQID